MRLSCINQEQALHFVSTFLFLTFFQLNLMAQDALNVELFGQIQRADTRYSGCWSYIAPDGSEYALLGAKSGTAIYNIDDPENIVELAFIPGGSSNWREIIVLGDYAYVTTEASGANIGMQVIDLTNLPDTATLVTNYMETFTRGHIIQKDIFSDAPYVYVNGTTATDGVHILDVSDPANPVEVGLYAPGYYIHDCHVRGDIMFAAAFYEGTLDIVDISDPSTPTLISRFDTPGGRTHSASMSMDGKYLFVAPEQDGLRGTVWNIEDYEDPTQVATYTANLESLVHNPYIRDDFMFISHNTEGLRVLDFADPELPVEVGFYDTFEGPSGGFAGLWSACPYFPSGKIIGGNRTDGLYVWTFNNTRAARIYGLVVDAFTQEPIVNASVTYQESNNTENTDLTGNFKFGNLAGNFTFEISQEGYESQTVSVSVAEGNTENILVELIPENATTVDEAFQVAINVFPNPAKDQLHIDLGRPYEGTVQLIDANGKLLNVLRADQSNLLNLDLQHLSIGKYWLEFRNEEKVLIARKTFLKQ